MTGISSWRLLELEKNHAAMNMAIDEAILISRSRCESPNTIRLYRWDPSAVSIGFFQSLRDEVDLETCKAEGVEVVRRITGGGAVFHDSQGEVTYSLITSESESIMPQDILGSYQVVCEGIIKGLKSLGVSADFQPVNDVVVRGRKISGNAQTRRLGVMLQHGTILVDADLEKMFRLLKVSDKKIRDKMITSAEKRVTTLKNELGDRCSLDDVAKALMRGFQEALKITLKKGELSSSEIIRAETLAKEKYANPEWTKRR